MLSVVAARDACITYRKYVVMVSAVRRVYDKKINHPRRPTMINTHGPSYSDKTLESRLSSNQFRRGSFASWPQDHTHTVHRLDR